MTLFPEIQAALVKAAPVRKRSSRLPQHPRVLRRGTVVALALFTVSGSALAVVVTRDDSYLNATSRELAGTPLSLDAVRGEMGSAGRDIKEIRREMIVQGHQVYAIEGPRTRCILIAGVNQTAGKSESIGCQPRAETKALGSSISLGAGQGKLHLIWTGPSAADVSAEADGQPLAMLSGPTILAVTRPDPDTAGVVRWTSADQPRSFDLISARELDPRRRTTAPAAGTP